MTLVALEAPNGPQLGGVGAMLAPKLGVRRASGARFGSEVKSFKNHGGLLQNGPPGGQDRAKLEQNWLQKPLTCAFDISFRCLM